MSVCACGALEVLDCECSLTDSDCIAIEGSGNATALVPSPRLDPDTDNLLTESATGLLAQLPATILNPPSCQVTHNANQSIPDDDGQVLAFNTENYDTDSMHDNVTLNTRITFQTPGVYIVTFNCAWAIPGSGLGDAESWIRKNGSAYLGKSTEQFQSTFEVGMTVIVQEFFEVGDYVQALVKQDSGGAVNLLSTSAYTPIFSARYRRGVPT